jgi:hypothetical protein
LRGKTVEKGEARRLCETEIVFWVFDDFDLGEARRNEARRGEKVMRDRDCFLGLDGFDLFFAVEEVVEA